MKQVHTYLNNLTKYSSGFTNKRLNLFYKTLIIIALTLFNTTHLFAQQDILDKPVTIKLSNITLADALLAIGDKASVNISYSNTRLDAKKIVNVDATNQPIKKILHELMGANLKLKVEGKVITIQTTDNKPITSINLNNNLNEVVVVSSRSPQIMIVAMC